MLRLVQAFIFPRKTYVATYATLLVTERRKIDTIIRKSYKRALALPSSTSTARPMALVVHNTLDELMEGHVNAQKE